MQTDLKSGRLRMDPREKKKNRLQRLDLRHEPMPCRCQPRPEWTFVRPPDCIAVRFAAGASLASEVLCSQIVHRGGRLLVGSESQFVEAARTFDADSAVRHYLFIQESPWFYYKNIIKPKWIGILLCESRKANFATRHTQQASEPLSTRIISG